MYMRSSGVSPGARKQLYGVVLPSSSLFTISPVRSSSRDLLPLGLQPESRGVYSSCSATLSLKLSSLP